MTLGVIGTWQLGESFWADAGKSVVDSNVNIPVINIVNLVCIRVQHETPDIT